MGTHTLGSYQRRRGLPQLARCLILLALTACQSLAGLAPSLAPPVATLNLPSLKNSPGECYYLDDFMPVPNNMVTGKSAALNLRYYTYNAATYKDWQDKQILLSFYSQDGHCWSLFEEYYVTP